MLVLYAIRNVQTHNFVQYMSEDGSQYKETDISGNFVGFNNEFQAFEYLKKKVKFVNSLYYFEVVKLYAVMP